MDNTRLRFLKGEQRKFLKLVYLQSGLSTEKLAEIAGIHPRSLRDWRREKLTMTKKAADVFCLTYNVVLPEKEEILIERWRSSQTEANRKGGFSLYKKYGCLATADGRRRGGIKAMQILRARGVVPARKIYKIPNYYTANLAEFVGILLGDGGLTSSQCFITLNAEADSHYSMYISRLWHELFGEAPKTYRHKNDKALVLYYSGVSFIEYLQHIGLKRGNKVKQQVDVPDWIKERHEYRLACLRGLMDTDGGLFIHRYKVIGKEYSYLKLSFANRSLPLLYFVYESLHDLGLSPKIVDTIVNKRVTLYNESNVKLYMEKVGSNNSRLLRFVESGEVA